MRRARWARKQKKGFSMPSPHVEKVIHHLFQPKEDQSPPQVWALLDAARTDTIYPKVFQATGPVACLFRGERAQKLAWVAPYLVKLRQGDPFAEWLLENGWGKSWGIFLESSFPIRKLRDHLRALLAVKDEEGKSFLFRYYDPRVFRVYLPTCNQSELEIIFRHVSRFWLEAEEDNAIVDYSLTSGELSEFVTRMET